MNNYSVPSVSYTRGLTNQRPHKHVRKKAIRSSTRATFGDGKSAEYVPLLSSDDSDEEITLHDLSYLRNRQKTPEKSSNSVKAKVRHQHSYSDPFLYCDFVTLELQEGDTLQSISVKYSCPISDLKRANNIISNQEFYGLRQLKIPVKKNSVLTEIIPAGNNGLQQIKNKASDDNVRTINIGIGPMLSNSTTQEAAAFLKRMDEDLVRIMLNTNSRKETLEEVTAALTEPRFHPLMKAPYNSVDGVQWSCVLIFIIVIAVIIPLIIVLYMYYTKSANHSQHNSTTLLTFSSTTKMPMLDKS